MSQADDVHLLDICDRVAQREGGKLGEDCPDDTGNGQDADLEDGEANAGQSTPGIPTEAPQGIKGAADTA